MFACPERKTLFLGNADRENAYSGRTQLLATFLGTLPSRGINDDDDEFCLSRNGQQLTQLERGVHVLGHSVYREMGSFELTTTTAADRLDVSSIDLVPISSRVRRHKPEGETC